MAFPSRLTDSLRKAINPDWVKFTFSDLWERNARTMACKEAVVDSSNRLSWSEANNLISRMAYGLLRIGLKKNDVVAVQLPNRMELPLLRIACERAGLICLPISRVMRAKEVELILKKADPKAFVCVRKFRGFDYVEMIAEIRKTMPIKHLIIVEGDAPPGCITLRSLIEGQEPLVEIRKILESVRSSAEEFCLVTHTTGTTGHPKLVENPIFSRMELARAQVQRIGLGPSDTVGVFSPNAGGPNTIGYFAAPLAGARIVLLEHFDPEEALRCIEREKISVLPVVPTMAVLMMNNPRFKDFDLRSLRILVAGGSLFKFHDALRAEEMFGCPVIQFYGSVDTGIGTMGSPVETKEIRYRTVGKPLGRCEIKIVKDDGNVAAPGEEGEIHMRSPDCLSGYYKEPEDNRIAWNSDGWFNLGDIGSLSHDGYLTVLGRKKELINRGGQKIFPYELEQIISQHPKVAEVAVIGMPDPVMGERSCAYVVARGREKITIEEINSFLDANNIARFKLIDRLEVVDELPLIGGKIDKRRLREDIIAKLSEDKNEIRRP